MSNTNQCGHIPARLIVISLNTGTILCYYKAEEEYSSGDAPIQRFNLTGAEAIPDVDVGKRKFAMNIILPSSDETGEIRLLFDSVSPFSIHVFRNRVLVAIFEGCSIFRCSLFGSSISLGMFRYLLQNI